MNSNVWENNEHESWILNTEVSQPVCVIKEDASLAVKNILTSDIGVNYIVKDGLVFWKAYATPISGVDVDTFEPVPYTFSGTSRNYARDKNHVYYAGKVLKWADVKTFYFIKWPDGAESIYPSDSTGNIYDNKGNTLNVDKDSFWVASHLYCYDKYWVYFMNLDITETQEAEDLELPISIEQMNINRANR